jgi:2-succinyl-5-enolpyruvyl-6-hydroxy-3-cyclohexene-1-carboxylate synthase
MTEYATCDVQAAFCSVLCDEWARAGVTDAIVAPGSRSTPLIAALDADPRIRVSVVLDERSAGFTALGCALASGRPTVVVTTSGTASVELHPAVAEADQAGVPLIAVTTDRPPELHAVGAPQTLDQHGLFGPSVRWAVDPGVADLDASGMWRSLGARVVAESMAHPGGPGPVHLNLPFREPLLGHPDRVPIPAARAGRPAWHAVSTAAAGPPSEEAVELLRSHRGGRGLIVAGAGSGPAALRLAGVLGWPLLADPRSGARRPSSLVVSAADPILRTGEFAAMVPDIVLRAGAPWASKVVGQWLARLPAGVPQVLVDPIGRWADPDRAASHVIRTDVSGLADALGEAAVPAAGEWVETWAGAERAARHAIDGLLGPIGELALSEPGVAYAAAGAVTAGPLLTSSSMPIRDVEWYGSPADGLRVLANRGVNGIDGVLSTALGVALAQPDGPAVALLGDLAFLYDAGSLLWAAGRPVDLRVVVIDNNGGGIFSFLPQAEALRADVFERYWGTPHGLDLVAVASAYGVAAERVESRAALDHFLAAPGSSVRVAVVPSDRADNVKAHERLNSEVAEAVADRNYRSH